MKKLKNRYGEEYHFEKVGEYTYTIVGDFQYWRISRGEDGSIDFVDPSGGPYIAVGDHIESGKIYKIREEDGKVLFDVCT